MVEDGGEWRITSQDCMRKFAYDAFACKQKIVPLTPSIKQKIKEMSTLVKAKIHLHLLHTW
jgi:hypothetical protein